MNVYLKMKAEYPSETTVSTSNTTPCHNTEYHHMHDTWCRTLYDTESEALQEQMRSMEDQVRYQASPCEVRGG
jgi:hypothetical protein